MPAVALSNFTPGPYGNPNVSPTQWFHTAEADKTVYVVVTYLTFAGEGVVTATFGGQAMTKQHVSEDAFAQFHTVEIFSLVNPPAGVGQISVAGVSTFRVASFNIANGPVDGCVTGVYTAMSGVTSRYLYGFGYDTDDLIVGWLDVFNVQLSTAAYTVTNGTQLHSGVRFGVGMRQGDGSETEIAFDTAGDTAGGEQLGLIFTIPAPQQLTGGMFQPYMSLVPLAASAQSICLPHCSTPVPTTISARNMQNAIPCTIRNLQINLKTPPGVGTSRRFEVYKNGVPQGVTVTISNLDTVAYMTGLEFRCHRWAAIEIRSTTTGGPANTDMTYCLEGESGEVGVWLSGPNRFGGSTPPALGGTGHSNVFMSALPVAGAGTWTLNRYDEGRIGCDMDLIGVFVYYFKEIGTARYDAYVWKSTDDGVSYVRQDGSGGTPNTYKALTRANGVTQAGASYWYIPMEVPFAVGDQAFLEIFGANDTGGGLATLGQSMIVGAVCRSRTNGEWFFNGETNVGALDFLYFTNQNWIGNPAVTDTPVSIAVGPLSELLTITGINWAMETPPGGGVTRTMILRHNAADSPLQAPITGAARSAQDGGDIVALPQHDTLNVSLTRVGTLDNLTMWWTIRGFMTPPVPPPPPGCPGEVTGPRTDGLPYNPPAAEPCAGPGTRGASRIGA